MDHTIPPHGGTLCRLLADPERAEQLKAQAREARALVLTPRQLCDLDLLLNGGFSPLRGFLGRADYESVLESMRLPSGALWPIPVTLDVPAKLADTFTPGERVALQDPEGFTHALLTVSEVWRPDLRREAEAVYGTSADTHPGVRQLHEQTHDTYVGGEVEGIEPPAHYDFENLWDTPEGLRELFARMGWRRVLACQPAGVIHRREREMILAAAKTARAHVLLHPAVGVSAPGDLHYYARVRCYQAVRAHFPHGLAVLSLLPLARRHAGPRSALWHALIQQNYGATHFLVEPHHGAPDGNGRHYPADAARELIARHESELAITAVFAEPLRYEPRRGAWVRAGSENAQADTAPDLDEPELRRRLSAGDEIPEWFSYPEVIEELRRVYPPRGRQGFTLFFTGLSGAGKSTLAKLVYAKLVEAGGRPVTLLDGDIVRRNLSSELGFSRAHRDINVRRIGFVASEITKNGGVAICAPIAPYAATRRAVRELIAEHGAFIEIHVATPLEVCEARDRKGLYEKARKGVIPEFTGISDPYEPPDHPEIRLDTTHLSPVEAAQEIFLYLLREGYLDSACE